MQSGALHAKKLNLNKLILIIVLYDKKLTVPFLD